MCLKLIKPLKKFKGSNLLIYSFVTLISAFLMSCSSEQSITDPATVLLPAPQKLEMKKGTWLNPQKFKKIYLCSESSDNTRFSATLLSDEINSHFGYQPEIEVVKSYSNLSYPSVILGVPSEDEKFKKFSSDIQSPVANNKESYVLDISKNSVTVSGGGEPGLFYGVQSLIQLLEEAKWTDSRLPGLVINDWPEIRHRLVHYNYFYHLDRYEYIKESITKLAKYKVNGIVFEFEDKFKYQSHPFVAAPNSLTSEQVKELTRFAHQYHIDIIPLVQGFGHAGYLLKHDEMKHLREDPEVYQSFCPMKEETYEFIFDLFRETIEATPGVKFFHVGADEVRVMGHCPLCSKKKEEIGELGIYLTWLNKVDEFMKEHDRTIIFWDDMPLKQAGLYRVTYNEADEKFDSIWTEGTAKLGNIITRFPQDAVFMRWNYELGRFKGNIKTLDWYKENNFNTMVATAIIPNWPLIPDYEWTPANIKSFVTLGAEKEVMGELCTAWGDDAGNHFEIYWLGFLASAEYAWSSSTPESLDQYWEKYVRRFFGPETKGLIPAFHNLSDRVEFWNTALMTKGMKNRKGYQLRPLPDMNNTPGEESWSKYYEPVVEKAKSEKILCLEALDTLYASMERVKANRYNLEVFASMGKLMEKHCDVVMAIGDIAGYCDEAARAKSEGEMKSAAENLQKMASAAEKIWNEYRECYEEVKEIWEVARYAKGGDGYKLNTQTNYLAGWTAGLSYLILAETQLDFPEYAKNLRLAAEEIKK
ncbi:MAG: family 20 glycosylhydrolase [Prolixibacteraceae bacterium]|nr:family 20 glycosylhydrolase [Prolixibacteraceae bacterium]